VLAFESRAVECVLSRERARGFELGANCTWLPVVCLLSGARCVDICLACLQSRDTSCLSKLVITAAA